MGLEAVEFVLAVEERFGVRLPPEALGAETTPATLAHLVAEKLAESRPGTRTDATAILTIILGLVAEHAPRLPFQKAITITPETPLRTVFR